MRDELKICIIADQNNLEKTNRAEEIFNELNNENRIKKIIKFSSIDKSISNISKLKPDAYLFLTDDIKEFNNYYKKLKKPDCSILITDNLETEFIQESINMSSEIIYGRSDMQNIIERIKKHIIEFEKAY